MFNSHGDYHDPHTPSEVVMNVENIVIELKRHHSKTWHDKSDLYWFISICEEVVELAGTLIGLHRGPVWWELAQISSIAMNWMENKYVTIFSREL